ncbi:uncharacterized protein TNCV_475001 [Trichonephila clavipes]|nr:uncharacterized protein TNCV_475001 [Trichonephila clavipes]
MWVLSRGTWSAETVDRFHLTTGQAFLGAYLHIDLEGNEIADTLAKASACEHHWYQFSRPGGSLAHVFTRQDQTLLDRLRCGHIKAMEFSEGCKSYEICMNCSSEPATSAYILECLGLTKQDLADDPLLVLYFLKM